MSTEVRVITLNPDTEITQEIVDLFVESKFLYSYEPILEYFEFEEVNAEFIREVINKLCEVKFFGADLGGIQSLLHRFILGFCFPDYEISEFGKALGFKYIESEWDSEGREHCVCFRVTIK